MKNMPPAQKKMPICHTGMYHHKKHCVVVTEYIINVHK